MCCELQEDAGVTLRSANLINHNVSSDVYSEYQNHCKNFS